MDDIFYMSSKKVRIKDIDEIAKRINVKKTFMPQSTDVLEVEYCDGVIVNWFCMRLEDFQELEDEDIKAATITALAQLALNNLCVNEVIKVLEDETERITDEDIKEFAEEVLEDIKNSNCADSL